VFHTLSRFQPLPMVLVWVGARARALQHTVLHPPVVGLHKDAPSLGKFERPKHLKRLPTERCSHRRIHCLHF
jgi:hypothetical protein